MTRFVWASLAAASLAAVLTVSALAAQDPAPAAAIPVLTTPLTSKQLFASECGACHWAYPAGFLPARSWQAITQDLSKHFGEDASLDPDTAKRIADYLVANAADAGGASSPILRGLGPKDVPLAITDMPFWKRIHGRFSPLVFERPDVTSKANCLACHQG